jgi:hypothetical protein
MKIYKISSLGSETVICDGGEREGAVSVLPDMREDVEYTALCPAPLFAPDVLRSLSAFLFFVKGLPPSTYTVSVNGTLTPIPVPHKSIHRFGGGAVNVTLAGQGRADTEIDFYDLSTPLGIYRAAVFENLPAVDFSHLGKSLARLGAEGGVKETFLVARASEGYSLSVGSARQRGGYTPVLSSAAYLIYRLFGDEEFPIKSDCLEAHCTVTPGGVSVFDTDPHVSRMPNG